MATEAQRVVPFEMRPALRLSATTYGLLAAGLYLAAGLGYLALLESAAQGPEPFAFARRSLVVLALMIGFLLAAWRYATIEIVRDLQLLGAAPPGDVDANPAVALAAPPEALHASRIAGAAGVVVFLVLLELPGLVIDAPLFSAWRRVGPFSWHVLGGIVWFWLVGRLAYLSIAGVRVPALRDGFEVDVLDLRPARAAGRIALRGSVAWVLGMSLGSLVLLNPEIQQRVSLVVVVPMLLLTGAITSASLLLPVRSVRRRTREAKRRELDAVEAAIRGEPDALAGSRLGSRSGPAPGLADLAAYRTLVTDIPEWPFEARGVRRLGLYLLIPLASWVGGAMVERFVDVVLP